MSFLWSWSRASALTATGRGGLALGLARIAAGLGECYSMARLLVFYFGVLAALVLCAGAFLAVKLEKPWEFRILAVMCLIVLFGSIYLTNAFLESAVVSS